VFVYLFDIRLATGIEPGIKTHREIRYP